MVINSILVYSVKPSNRLTYVLKTLLKEGLGLDYKHTSNSQEFENESGAKLNYSDATFENCVTIKPQGILFDYGIKDYPIEVIASEQYYKLFFKTNSFQIPFDLFGAAFWLLTRYEEYLPHKSDKYKRFHYRSSLAYQYNFLHLPLINLWLKELQTILANHFPELVFKTPTYSFLSSIDIDNAYKYKHKGFVRALAGFISDRRFSKMAQRLRIILNKEKDPFDCYDFLIQAHKEKNIQAIYFFLLGDYGPNDKNHSAANLQFQVLIKHLADYSMVGIHPSFGSNTSLHQLKVETNRLSNITHKTITKSRQHFSMLRFPKTYQDLLQTGIVMDYSMGYSNANGFRASYCYPFKWYNLEIESTANLLVHPFSLTDITLSSQAQQMNKPILEIAQPFIDEHKKYGGQLMSIFHNDLFTDDMKKFYLDFLEEAK